MDGWKLSRAVSALTTSATAQTGQYRASLLLLFGREAAQSIFAASNP